MSYIDSQREITNLKEKIKVLEARLQNNDKCLEELLLKNAYLQSDLGNLRTKSKTYKEICSLKKSNDWLKDRNSALEKAARSCSYKFLYGDEISSLKRKISYLEREADMERSDPKSAEASKKISELERKVANFDAREE
ncbi:hypothetical protein L6452_35975 [Arctium lappa]|uniref:Uncharacterized protein n=1 Tax=Arctium lappa TaxID=4217 RepID=A0ACB8Y8M3_ARCLA|nr:hypothetical protein L6452_35975 [Arctium lappa]